MYTFFLYTFFLKYSDSFERGVGARRRIEVGPHGTFWRILLSWSIKVDVFRYGWRAPLAPTLPDTTHGWAQSAKNEGGLLICFEPPHHWSSDRALTPRSIILTSKYFVPDGVWLMGRSTSNVLFMIAGNAISSLPSIALKPLLHLRRFKTPLMFRFIWTTKGIVQWKHCTEYRHLLCSAYFHVSIYQAIFSI